MNRELIPLFGSGLDLESHANRSQGTRVVEISNGPEQNRELVLWDSSGRICSKKLIFAKRTQEVIDSKRTPQKNEPEETQEPPGETQVQPTTNHTEPGPLAMPIHKGLKFVAHRQGSAALKRLQNKFDRLIPADD